MIRQACRDVNRTSIGIGHTLQTNRPTRGQTGPSFDLAVGGTLTLESSRAQVPIVNKGVKGFVWCANVWCSGEGFRPSLRLPADLRVWGEDGCRGIQYDAYSEGQRFELRGQVRRPQ